MPFSSTFAVYLTKILRVLKLEYNIKVMTATIAKHTKNVCPVPLLLKVEGFLLDKGKKNFSDKTKEVFLKVWEYYQFVTSLF